MREQGLSLVEKLDGSVNPLGSLAELAQPIRSVPGDMSASQLDEIFRLDEELRWVMLSDVEAPVLVQRSTFESLITGRLGYGRLLYGRLGVADLPLPPTLVLAEEMTVAAAAAAIIDRQQTGQRPAGGASAGLVPVAPEGVLLTHPDGVRVACVSDIFQRLALHFARQALHDPLTGLPNRLHLTQQLAEVSRSGEPATLLYLDLDRFKDINDQHGHAAGDQVLVQFGERLQAISRSDDVVARLGGDEFAVLSRGPMTAEQSQARADRIVLAAAAPFIVTTLGRHGDFVEQEVFVGASVGLTHAGPTGADAHAPSLEVLLRQADLAMYRAKRHGRGRVEHFDRVLLPSDAEAEALMHQRGMERRLRTAIDQRLLTLHFQPVVTLPEAVAVGVEALVRWDDPELGSVAPEQFIPLAERTGLIHDLGSWVLHEACAQAAQWQTGAATPWVSVNVSPIEIAQSTIVEQVAQALTVSGLAPDRLRLEVTETAAIEDFVETAQRLEQLSALGVRICLDDFGTGHSSLTMLRDLPVDVVKVDRSFVRRIATNAGDAVLVRLVIETAHSLGMTVCAEGIEEPAQARQLAALGCDTAQGWYFGMPQAASSQLTAELHDLTPRFAGGDQHRAAAPLLIPGSEELMLVTTPRGVITYVSATVRRQLGWSPAELVGKSVLPHLHPQDRPSAADVSVTHRVRHRDGSYRWVHSTIQRLTDDRGADTEVLSLSRDVTEAVQARLRLKQSEQQFQQACDHSPVAMALTRLDGAFVRVNAAFQALVGRSAQALLAMRVEDITHPDDRDADARNHDALRAGSSRGHDVDKRYLHADGHTLDVRVSVSLVGEPGSASSYLIANVLERH